MFDFNLYTLIYDLDNINWVLIHFKPIQPKSYYVYLVLISNVKLTISFFFTGLILFLDKIKYSTNFSKNVFELKVWMSQYSSDLRANKIRTTWDIVSLMSDIDILDTFIITNAIVIYVYQQRMQLSYLNLPCKVNGDSVKIAFKLLFMFLHISAV